MSEPEPTKSIEQPSLTKSAEGFTPNPATREFAAAMRSEGAGAIVKGAIGAASLIGVTALAGLWLFFKPSITEALGGLPGGAVVAFDRSQCPIGWSAYKPAISRVIIGWGSVESGLKSSVDAHMKLLPVHGGSEIDGEETKFVMAELNGTENEQHRTTMPPYVALNYCQKDYKD
jgi:hypothetical protein